MDDLATPLRSVLYVPGDNAKALAKARSLPTDALILDLEDAVAPDAKAAAREAVAAELRQGGFGATFVVVRINGLHGDWGQADLAALAQAAPAAVLLPKVETAEAIEGVAAWLDRMPAAASTRIWAMIETPKGVLNAPSIAAAPGMGGLVVGTNDLAMELRLPQIGDRACLATALQTCVLAARAAGIVVIDGVQTALDDADALHAECEQGRAWGFDGKSLIHPAQIATANAVFAPTDAEIAQARRRIAAFEAAEAEGRAVAVTDGAIVEALHVRIARRTIAKARAIGMSKE